MISALRVKETLFCLLIVVCSRVILKNGVVEMRIYIFTFCYCDKFNENGTKWLKKKKRLKKITSDFVVFFWNLLVSFSIYFIALSSLQTHTDTLQRVQIQSKELSHLDIYCLPFCYWFLTETPICTNGCIQIQRWKSPFQKLRDERMKLQLVCIIILFIQAASSENYISLSVCCWGYIFTQADFSQNFVSFYIAHLFTWIWGHPTNTDIQCSNAN